MNQNTSLNWIAALLFALAVLHTFAANRIHAFAHRFPESSIKAELFRFLGEVEAVFPLWSAVLLLTIALIQGRESAIRYSESLNFTEPLFVFVILLTAATRPVHRFASGVIGCISTILSLSGALSPQAATYLTALTFGPLLGSFITEPAAMAIVAMILRERFFDRNVTDRFKYLTLAVLFVNVSIGGVLTPYAAPPVLMVADAWRWDFSYMFIHFGWKAAVAVFINAGLATLILQRELKAVTLPPKAISEEAPPRWLITIHLMVLGAIVWSSHHPVLFIGIFLLFLALVNITRRYHESLKYRESLLVAAFLGGLVILGGWQNWWLSPLIQGLDSLKLFLGATGLTAITDNAALTYLGSQVHGMSESAHYALLAGAVAGGGLTVIANAPNPAGYSILQTSFGEDGIHPGQLLIFALIPTLIAMGCFWVLPS